MIKFFVFYLWILSPSLQAGELLNANELALPDFQASALSKDLPAADLMVYAAGENALILGQSSLWRWSLETNGLTRFDLGEKKGTLQKIIPIGAEQFAIIGRDVMLLINLSPFKIYHLNFPGKTSGESLGAFPTTAGIVWVQTTGIASVALSMPPQIERTKAGLVLTPADHIQVTPDGHWLWIARKRTLMRANLSGEDMTPMNIHETAEDFDGAATDGERILAWTKHAVLAFSLSGRLLQAIPVDGLRTLSGTKVNSTSHSYLFSDGLVEIYDLASQSKISAVLSASRSLISNLTTDSTTAGMLQNGLPRVFQLHVGVTTQHDSASL